jgi:hypothetical protein
MKKKEIISLAESMGFVLEYDRFYEKPHPTDVFPVTPFMLFVHKDSGTKWIWHKEDSDKENIAAGNRVLNCIKQNV